MLKDLVKLANDLDAKGLRAEADYLDSVIQKCAQMSSADENSMSIISNIQEAIDAVQSGKSFRFPISKSDEDKINSLTKSSSPIEVALEKRAFLSRSDILKVVGGALGILGALMSLAMYFGYNIRLSGKRGKTEGELVFEAPGKTPEIEDSNLLGEESEDTISLPLDNKAPALIG